MDSSSLPRVTWTPSALGSSGSVSLWDPAHCSVTDPFRATDLEDGLLVPTRHDRQPRLELSARSARGLDSREPSHHRRHVHSARARSGRHLLQQSCSHAIRVDDRRCRRGKSPRSRAGLDILGVASCFARHYSRRVPPDVHSDGLCRHSPFGAYTDFLPLGLLDRQRERRRRVGQFGRF